MAALNEKIEAEVRMRKLIADADLPMPDAIEYGYDCIRLFWSDAKVVVVIDFESESESDAGFESETGSESEGASGGGVPP
jgi:hypothetical protein